jgi:hypothetical protein
VSSWPRSGATSSTKRPPGSIGVVVLPSDLLHAVVERRRLIALVVGAGCSFEPPTNLQLARAYAEEAYRRLVQDGELGADDCPDPSDLSALASAVVAKCGSQRPLVIRLPRHDFRMARPNSGYMIAAALLRESVLAAVITLNFDLALTAALGELGATDVDIITGPLAMNTLGEAAVIYLHRSVEENDVERWILTTEALERDWRDGWEEVITRRVTACPVVIFAGLGSPAAVLTESVTRVRQPLNPDQHHIYVVDPSATTQFQSALDLSSDAHVQTGWCAFMLDLAARLLGEFIEEMISTAHQLCDENQWNDEVGHIPDLVKRLHAIGLVSLGKLRSAWLMSDEPYLPEIAPRRRLIADLLLGVGLIERTIGRTARFRDNGTVELIDSSSVIGSILPMSGSGTLRWAGLEAKALEFVGRIDSTLRPEIVLTSGVTGHRSSATAAPEDIIAGATTDDIVDGIGRPRFLSVDDIRADPGAVAEVLR